MQSQSPGEHSHGVQPVVHAILSQMAKRRLAGLITAKDFDTKIIRLSKEELEPQGLKLLVRNLDSGGIRFVVKTASDGTTRDVIDHGGTALKGDVIPVAT